MSRGFVVLAVLAAILLSACQRTASAPEPGTTATVGSTTITTSGSVRLDAAYVR